MQHVERYIDPHVKLLDPSETVHVPRLECSLRLPRNLFQVYSNPRLSPRPVVRMVSFLQSRERRPMTEHVAGGETRGDSDSSSGRRGLSYLHAGLVW